MCIYDIMLDNSYRNKESAPHGKIFINNDNYVMKLKYDNE